MLAKVCVCVWVREIHVNDVRVRVDHRGNQRERVVGIEEGIVLLLLLLLLLSLWVEFKASSSLLWRSRYTCRCRSSCRCVCVGVECGGRGRRQGGRGGV